MISELFYETLIADIEEIKTNIVRTFITKDGKEPYYNDQIRITAIASDERLP